MKEFFYEAKDIKGENVTGIISADSLPSAVSVLHSRNLIVINIEEIKKSTVVAKVQKPKGLKRRRISLLDLAVYFRQMATMVKAGVPILDSLYEISQTTTSLKLKKILEDIANEIKTGHSLSTALKKYPKVFSELIVSMVIAGEESGRLSDVLMRLANYLEEQVRLKNKVISAMTYPAVIFTFFCIVLCVVLFVMVPKFESIYKSYGIELHPFTEIILNISRFLVTNMIFFVPLILFLFCLIGYLYNTQKKFRYFIDDKKLKLFIFGDLLKKVIFTRFCSTLSTLISSGVSLVPSLDIVSKVVGSLPIKENINLIKLDIIKGSSLSSEMEKYEIFPGMLTKMVKIGESSGKVDEMLNCIAEYYKDETDRIISSLTSIIEPIMIIFMGVVIGVVVIALYLPIFKMATGVAR